MLCVIHVSPPRCLLCIPAMCWSASDATGRAIPASAQYQGKISGCDNGVRVLLKQQTGACLKLMQKACIALAL